MGDGQVLSMTIGSREIAFCPVCKQVFPEIIQRGKTPTHQILDTLAFCSGAGQDLKVRKVRKSEIPKRTLLAVH